MHDTEAGVDAGRRSTSKDQPGADALREHFRSMDYPAGEQDLIDHARKNHAPDSVFEAPGKFDSTALTFQESPPLEVKLLTSPRGNTAQRERLSRYPHPPVQRFSITGTLDGGEYRSGGGGFEEGCMGTRLRGGEAPSPAPSPNGDTPTVHSTGDPGEKPVPGRFSPSILSGNRRRYRFRARLATGYPHALPPPPGRGVEADGGAGGGDGGERFLGDRTEARYGLFVWNRCTSSCVATEVREAGARVLPTSW